MTILDWLIVIVLNGSVIVYALVRSRGTHTSGDWFLAGKTLPFWIVGLSLYATLIDSADLVADTGGAYRHGVRLFVPNLVGVVGGWLLLANFVAIPMYRRGMYTNAEYLEARFGVGARVISVLVQVLYRTVMIGMISTAIFLTLTVICGWGSAQAWLAVGAVALLATIYTAAGGLRSVAITDAMQAVVILVAAIVIFGVVSGKVGGWGGLEDKIAETDPVLAEQMMHIGADRIDRVDATEFSDDELARHLKIGGSFDRETMEISRITPAWLIILSFIIVGFAYSIVNHTQSMRLLGARSEWHMKMAIVPAGLLLILMTYLSLGLGVLGRGLYANPADLPDGRADNIFPHVIEQFGAVGLTGLVVAGIFAAAFSTYDSIGSSLSALITRDIYGRLLVKNRDDRHYLGIGRWLTPVIIFGSFGYVPLLLRQGMIDTYLSVVGSFVVPLLTVYLLGAFTRVHRSSALPGLVVGVGFGVVAMIAPGLAVNSGTWLLPPALINGYATAPLGCLVTALTMLAVSAVRGWTPKEDLLVQPDQTDGWLARSQEEVIRTLDLAEAIRHRADSKLPLALGLAVWAIALVLTFVVFW